MSRFTDCDREILAETEERTSPSSFTPINRHPSSFKPAPKVIRRHSGEFLEAAETYKYTSKRSKTEPATQDSEQENVSLGSNRIPNSLHLNPSPKLKSSKKKTTSKKRFCPPELFPDVPVTKPKRRQKSQPGTISYQGYTTTQHALKNSTQLAQTTLDKLAAFKYKPTLIQDQEEVPLGGIDPHDLNHCEDNSQTPMLLDDENEGYVSLTTSRTMALDEDNVQLLNVSHFEDAHFDDAVPTSHSPHHGSCTNETQTRPSIETSMSLPKQSSGFDIYAEIGCLNDQGFLSNQTLNFPVGDAVNIARDYDRSNFDSLKAGMTETLATSSQSKVDSEILSNTLLDGRKCHMLAANNHANLVASIDSNMMCSYLNEMNEALLPTFNSQVQQEMSLSDIEFGDGDIGDEDLHAISLGSKGEQECEPKANNPNHSSNTVVSLVAMNSSHGVRESHFELTSRNDLSHANSDCSTSINSAHRDTLKNGSSPGSEDEFSMDEAETNALMLLNVSFGTVHETQPPPCVPFPSDGESQDLEVYDPSLQYSDLSLTTFENQDDSCNISTGIQRNQSPNDESNKESEEENWPFLGNGGAIGDKTSASKHQEISTATGPSTNLADTHSTKLIHSHDSSQLAVCNDSETYLPLNPFARPQFPAPMPDRSPVIGFSGSLVLRTCFRIGEAFRVAAASDSASYEVMLELFARVTFSSREEGTVKQHFQFIDLFHDHPPFLNGFLENYKVSDLANTESKQLLGKSSKGQLIRCLGKMRREFQLKRMLVIKNIRATDWEEIRRTKMIVEDLNGKRC